MRGEGWGGRGRGDKERCVSRQGYFAPELVPIPLLHTKSAALSAALCAQTLAAMS